MTKPLDEISNIESKKDISCLCAQYDKVVDFINAPQSPVPTRLVED